MYYADGSEYTTDSWRYRFGYSSIQKCMYLPLGTSNYYHSPKDYNVLTNIEITAGSSGTQAWIRAVGIFYDIYYGQTPPRDEYIRTTSYYSYPGSAIYLETPSYANYTYAGLTSEIPDFLQT